LNAYSNSILFAALDKNQNPIFQKNYTLRKVLNMFTNKIYQAPSKSQDGQQSVYEEIKIEICQIYFYLLDIRTEYLIENCISFFKQRYIPAVKTLNILSISDTNLVNLMPAINLEAGESPSIIRHHAGRTIDKHSDLPEFRHFDNIIDRSFMEVLTIAHYFSNTAGLQRIVVDVVIR
jgi:inositol 1,4,5-triphosphate receptor type 3